MSAYSLDLRERIVAACCAGQSHVTVAQTFGVCSKTVQRYVARARRGELAPRPLPGRAPRLAKQDEANFVVMLQETSNWTLLQLQQEWQQRSGVFLPRSTLHDHVKRLGGRYKKRVELPENAAR